MDDAAEQITIVRRVIQRFVSDPGAYQPAHAALDYLASIEARTEKTREYLQQETYRADEYAQKLRDAKERIRELEAGLETYGRHRVLSGCGMRIKPNIYTEEVLILPCNCGLEELIAGVPWKLDESIETDLSLEAMHVIAYDCAHESNYYSDSVSPLMKRLARFVLRLIKERKILAARNRALEIQLRDKT